MNAMRFAPPVYAARRLGAVWLLAAGLLIGLAPGCTEPLSCTAAQEAYCRAVKNGQGIAEADLNMERECGSYAYNLWRNSVQAHLDTTGNNTRSLNCNVRTSTVQPGPPSY